MNHERLRYQQIPLHFQAALDRLGGNVVLLQDLARIFLEDYGDLLERLRTCLESRDSASAERLAHSLKGLSANFDRLDLMESCAEAEQFAQRGAFDDIQTLLPVLRNQAARLAADLRQIL